MLLAFEGHAVIRVRVYALRDIITQLLAGGIPDGKKTKAGTYRMGIGPAPRLSRET